MRRFKDILLIGFLAFGAISCIDDKEEPIPAPVQEMSYINLYITSGAPTSSTTATRAETDVKSVNGENIIHTVKVWVFGPNAANDGTELYGFAEDKNFTHDATDKSSDALYKMISIAIPQVYVDRSPNVNIYALANAESVNLGSLNDAISGITITETQLQNQIIASDYFGQANPITGNSYISETGNGLPIARVVTSVPLEQMKSDQNPLRIVLQRSIARMRFFVSKQSGIEDADFKLTSIQVASGLIPTATKVFPASVGYDDVKNIAHNEWPQASTAQLQATPTYETSSLNYTAETTSIAAMKDPETLIRANKSDLNAQAYADSLSQYTTLYNVTYLRETAETNFTLTVNYTLNGEAKNITKEFGNVSDYLLRNKEVIVYMYLKQGQLYVEPTVLPWDLRARYTYKTDVSAQLSTAQQYLRWDIDGNLNSDSWAGSFVAVTHEWDDQSNVPGRTPLIYLKTTSSESMYLQLDNPKFEFVVQTSNESVPYQELGANARLEIASGVNVETYFFVRPIEAYNTAANPLPSREAHMSLVSNGGTPAKVPLRSNMPGFAEGVDEVWFYWVSPSDYKEYPMVDPLDPDLKGTGPDGIASVFVN